MSDSVQAEIKKERRRYPVLDLVRFIAALLIIFIHIFPEGSTTSSVGLDPTLPVIISESFVYAIIRVAAPIFFFISSFLLFKRIEEDKENGWKKVGSFCLRLLFLYLFWYVVGLPLTIKDIVGFATSGDTNGLIRYFVITFWKGAPRGYWFLVSLAFSVFIANIVKGKKGLIVLTVISLVMYVFGCLNSAYFGIFVGREDPFSKGFYFIGEYLELSFCYLEALLFVILGKIFALYGPFKIKGNIVFIVISFFLMVTELFLTISNNLLIYPDAYFSLPIFIFFFMNRILMINIESESFAKKAERLKKIGSFSYLFHIQFFVYLHWILDSCNCNIFRQYIALLLIPYVVVVGLCFILQPLCERLSRYRYLRFLRYSY